MFLRRNGLLALCDFLSWATAILAAQFLRFDYSLSSINFKSTWLLIAAMTIGQIVVGWSLSLYRNRYKIGSFDEVRSLFLVTVVVMFAGLFISLISSPLSGIPRTTLVIAAPIAFSMMGIVRYLLREYLERRRKPGTNAARAIIYGAGYVGTLTVQRLLTDTAAGLLPLALIDDAPSKQNYSVRGVRVRGTIEDLSRVAQKTGADTLIVCIGYADAELLQDVVRRARSANLRVLVLPPFEDLLADPAAVSNLREISIEDLIGRHPVRLEMDSIAKYLHQATVLVTGAGGSIGAELCRQLTAFNPAEIIMLDRDETGLQQTQISIHGHGLLDTKDVVLADIRDLGALKSIFSERRPTVVFHAAALKHLPMLEQYPEEAWKSNVVGTLNVLEAAAEAGVSTFVNISTDKAANPTSVLGHSKRVAERLTANFGRSFEMRCISVRFGNVIGSRGSMLPTFTTLIEAGGPLTITDPDVTRFFMTIPEACQLVIQAGGIGRSGEVLILDMGEPVRIMDVAQRMIDHSGREIEIVFTGLRPGEKLHEELVGDGESDERPFHEKISHAKVKGLSPSKLDFDEWSRRLNAPG